jgi:hypothetical protein
MSRGLGRCQRRIIELLEKSPERRANRAELEEVLVGSEGFDESNVLRSIKSLAQHGHVIFEDDHRKKDSSVRRPRMREPIPESWVFEVLAQIGVDR